MGYKERQGLAVSHGDLSIEFHTACANLEYYGCICGDIQCEVVFVAVANDSSIATNFNSFTFAILGQVYDRSSILATTPAATTNFLDFFTLESSRTNFISTQHTAEMSYEKPI